MALTFEYISALFGSTPALRQLDNLRVVDAIKTRPCYVLSAYRAATSRARILNESREWRSEAREKIVFNNQVCNKLLSRDHEQAS